MLDLNGLIPATLLTHDERLDDPFLRDRRHQFRQVAHDLARLVRVGIEKVDRHHPPDGGARRRRERFDVVLVMPHPQCLRQSALRHVR